MKSMSWRRQTVSCFRCDGELPHPNNPVGHKQYMEALQMGLHTACGYTMEAARLRKGHCPRVGGSDYMRELGIEDEVHRRLGGWMSLVSSRGYMRISVEGRIKVKSKMGI